MSTPSADSTVRILLLSRFCLDFPPKSRPVSVYGPDSVMIFEKKLSVISLSVRPDKDDAGMSRLSVSLSADVCLCLRRVNDSTSYQNDSFLFLFEESKVL